MAYPEFAEPGVVPFFDQLMAAGKLQKNVFAFHMSINPEKESSEMTLGNWDQTKFRGNLEWYPVLHRKFFSIKLDDVKVKGKSLGLCASGHNCLITPDSGTGLISFP